MSQMDEMFLNACKNGQKGVAQTLLAKGEINVNKRDPMGLTALHYASQKGARDLVSMLLEKGADACACSNDSVTPLHMSSRSGNKDVIRMLIDAGADVNATDRGGRTPLMAMASEGKVDAAKMLLEAGADPSIADNDGHTVMDIATSKGLKGLVSALAEAGGTSEVRVRCSSQSTGARSTSWRCFSKQERIRPPASTQGTARCISQLRRATCTSEGHS